MSKRHPTAEEILLWRDINRTTRKNPDIVEAPLPSVSEEAHTKAKNKLLKVTTPIASTTPRAQPAKTPLVPLSSREAKKRLNIHSEIEASLDLHGYSRLDAYALVQAFINRHYAQGHRHLVIITGKGRIGEGVLRNELPHWLNEPGLRRMVTAFFHAREREGGTGVVHVMLGAPR